MAYASGSVVLGPDILKLLDPELDARSIDGVGQRPFLIVSNDQRPFYPDEYTVMTITTTERDIALPISDDVVVEGGLKYDSYCNPWTVTPIQSNAITGRVTQVTDSFVERAWVEFWRYHGNNQTHP